jgi:hypothetical protein
MPPKRRCISQRPVGDIDWLFASRSWEQWEETKTLLEFCCFCKLNEVLGPVTLSEEWLGGTTLAGLRRCLRASACTCH